MSEDKEVELVSTKEKEARLKTIQAWVKSHLQDVYIDTLLKEANISRYLAPMTCTRFNDHHILLRSPTLQDHKRPPSPFLEAKRKKPWAEESGDNSSDLTPPHPARQSFQVRHTSG